MTPVEKRKKEYNMAVWNACISGNAAEVEKVRSAFIADLNAMVSKCEQGQDRAANILQRMRANEQKTGKLDDVAVGKMLKIAATYTVWMEKALEELDVMKDEE
jgi:hypothetical protein